MDFSTYVLMYGDYADIQTDLIKDMLRVFPKEALPKVNVWCNQVVPATLELLKRTPFTVYETSENIPKYPLMRRMFQKVESPWILWLDDDTRFVQDDWYEKTDLYLQTHPQASYLGQGWVCCDFADRLPFIQESKWYKGKPPQIIRGRPGCDFAIGGYWLLRTDVQKQIDWPDPRLRHCGGDTLLAEAVRQAGHSFHKYAYGIQVQKRERRGIKEAPAGMRGYKPPDTAIDESKLKVWKGQQS
jgi:hypothetical protein